MSDTLPHHAHRKNDAMSDRIKKKFAAYTPRKRAPDEVLPMAVNVWALPVYEPDHHASARPGADDHLRIKSRGV